MSVANTGMLFAVLLIATAASAEQVKIRVSEGASPVPCRIHLRDADGKFVLPEGVPSWRDHFSCDGQIDLELAAGKYEYAIHRGPEYESKKGTLSVEPGRPASLTAELMRINHLRKLGWYAADLHVHRKYQDVPLLMRAADLDFAPVITWWNKNNAWNRGSLPERVLHQFDGHRLLHLMAGEDERGGGALLYFGMQQPIDITQAEYETTSPMDFVEQARAQNPNVWIDIEKPFWWDVPTWLASGKMNSIGIANNHMMHDTMYENEAWGYARDAKRLPAPKGNGYWTQEIYYHILNSGIRIPPSAGSASGVLKNPVGYNRVYVHLDEPFGHDAWWKGLARGQCFVTNGPQLICKANGAFPGAELKAAAGETLSTTIEIELVSEDAIVELAVIGNGEVIERIPCDPDTRRQRFTTNLSTDESGWFLIRAIAKNDKTFRFASTGPFYVRIGEESSAIRAASVRFFQRWLNARIQRLRAAVPDAADRQRVLQPHVQAQGYWEQRLAESAK